MANVGSESKQQRVTIVIVFVTLMLVSLFLAQGTTRLLAEKLLAPDPGATAAADLAATTPDEQPAVSSADVANAPDKMRILHRNIFDSQSGALDVVHPPPSEETAPPPTPVPDDPNRPPPNCDGSMRLVAAVFVPGRPEASMAAITNVAGKVLVYRKGEQIDGREVVEVMRDEVRLRPSGAALCRLGMFSPTTPAVAAATPVPAPEQPPTPPAPDPGGTGMSSVSAQDLDANIQRVSDTEYTINRSLVTRILEDRAGLMRMARVVPFESGGRTVGVKMYGIRRNGLLGHLGLENGDILRSINGYDMTDPNSALEAYARLRSADHLTVSVERRGTPSSFNYNIR